MILNFKQKTHPENDSGVPVVLCIEYMYWRCFIL